MMWKWVYPWRKVVFKMLLVPLKVIFCIIWRYSSELAELVLLQLCVWYTHYSNRFHDCAFTLICRCHNNAYASSFFLYVPKLLQCLSLSFDLWSKLFQISILLLCNLFNKLFANFSNFGCNFRPYSTVL